MLGRPRETGGVEERLAVIVATDELAAPAVGEVARICVVSGRAIGIGSINASRARRLIGLAGLATEQWKDR